jgi:hypothetical protein
MKLSVDVAPMARVIKLAIVADGAPDDSRILSCALRKILCMLRGESKNGFPLAAEGRCRGI